MPTDGPRGDKENGVEIPEGRELVGKEDAVVIGGTTAVIGGTTADTAVASPMTASRGPAATTAGARGGPSRDGGGPRAGGIRRGEGAAMSRAPGARAVEKRRTSRAETSDRGAAQEELLAEG